MRRFLVVGCGGSGGKTLAYLMDQLRSDLAKDGIAEHPGGLAVRPHRRAVGGRPGPGRPGQRGRPGRHLRRVRPAAAVATPILDAARVASSCGAAQALDGIATWAPRDPKPVTTPIAVGAGQYRAIGRMIMLARPATSGARLQQAWRRLFRPRDRHGHDQRRRRPGHGDFDPNLPPIVFVVGVDGRRLRRLDGARRLPAAHPDPGGQRQAHRGLHGQRRHLRLAAPGRPVRGPGQRAGHARRDRGQPGRGGPRSTTSRCSPASGSAHGDGDPIPFARVFPVGRLMGVRPHAVRRRHDERGLPRPGPRAGRPDDAATWPAASSSTSTSATAGRCRPTAKYLGWGAEAKPIPWGSYGFASLSMGRDRYAEYAAQRIARASVDRLLDGHLQPGSQASGDRAGQRAARQPVGHRLRPAAATGRRPVATRPARRSSSG